MHTSARVVIIGSGIAGSSIAYHLTQLGWHDVVVLEQGELISGTTSHAPGLVGQLRSSVSLTKMLMYSAELYKALHVDGRPGYFNVGSLRLASSPERLEEIKRQANFAHEVGLEAELMSPSEIERLDMFPLMSMDGILGGLYVAGDGTANAPVLARALANAARQNGVTFYPQTRVTAIEVHGGRVQAVETTRGRIQCEIIVAATGIWSPRIGRMAGVTIPLIPMQHQYMLSEPLHPLVEGVHVVNLRDPDKLVYYRQEGTSLILGGYERNPVAFDVDAIPDTANPTMREFDHARFADLLANGSERVPALLGGEALKRVNGLEAFTPDGEFILGEAPEVRGFWTACGFCAHGVSGAGGVGKALAEWIVQGKPELDLRHMDIRRFTNYTASQQETEARVIQIYSTYYDMLNKS